MCGIAGDLAVGREIPDRAAVERMIGRLRHRGPDGSGIYAADRAILGHRRLTIIDLSDASAQPMVDPVTNCCVTYNGEIYNYIELREQLTVLGHQFSTSGDTEVLLKAYAQWGEGCVDHIVGMFAFVIVNPASRQAFGARDRMGQKPLIYSHDQERLVFASELVALLEHPSVRRRIDVNSLCHYLIYEGFVDDQVILEGARRLPPGSYFLFDMKKGDLEVRRYKGHQVRESDATDCDPTPNDMNRLQEIVRLAVTRHLRSDVPVGIFLSGGVDSSLLATMATDILGGPRVQTFTVRHMEPSFDEADQARMVAEQLGTQHREMSLAPKLVLETVPRILDQLDEPLADPGLVSIYQVAGFASQTVKVVLSGDGGDELFCGYEPFHKWQLATRCEVMPVWMAQNLVTPLIQRLPAQYGYMGLFYKAQLFSRGFAQPETIRNQLWIGAFSAAELRRLIRNGADLSVLRENRDGIAPVYDPVIRVHKTADAEDPILRLALEYQSIYLPTCICAHTDKANMMHSLEARSPLLDPDVIKYANNLPIRWKLRNGVGKWILRNYLGDRLGKSVGKRRKKGFTVPLAKWLRCELKPLADKFLAPDAIESSGFFNTNEVDRLWREHVTGMRNNYKKLWAILVAQVWQHRVLGI